jgi:hypothetical protein
MSALSLRLAIAPWPVRAPRPSYKVICISMYLDDLKALDEKVEALKAAGIGKANRSHLIRLALAMLDMPAAIEAMKAAR